MEGASTATKPRETRGGAETLIDKRMMQIEDQQLGDENEVYRLCMNQRGREREAQSRTVELDQTQQQIVDFVVRNRRSVFITGGAGTGKSTVMFAIHQRLKEMGVNVVMTATTGVAGMNVGGTTFHNWGGLKPGYDKERQLNAIRRNAEILERWKKIEVILLDEISMYGRSLLSMINYIAQEIRGNTQTMAGICFVFAGDFLQLAAVDRDEEFFPKAQPFLSDFERGVIESSHVFKTPLWEALIQRNVFVLGQNYRAGQDTLFISILNAIRDGTISSIAIEVLMKICYVPELSPVEAAKMGYMVLMYTNKRVDQVNEEMSSYIAQREGTLNTLRTYKSSETVIGERDVELEELRAQGFVIYPVDPFGNSHLMKELRLFKGAQVMMLMNRVIDGVLIVNGQMGIVRELAEETVTVDFWPQLVDSDLTVPPTIRVTLRKETHIESASIMMESRYHQIRVKQMQFPLRVAYASTIHKAQARGFRRIYVYIEHLDRPNLAYVALSRATSLDGVLIGGEGSLRFQPDKDALHYYQKLAMRIEKSRYELLMRRNLLIRQQCSQNTPSDTMNLHLNSQLRPTLAYDEIKRKYMEMRQGSDLLRVQEEGELIGDADEETETHRDKRPRADLCAEDREGSIPQIPLALDRTKDFLLQMDQALLSIEEYLRRIDRHRQSGLAFSAEAERELMQMPYLEDRLQEHRRQLSCANTPSEDCSFITDTQTLMSRAEEDIKEAKLILEMVNRELT